MRRTLVLAALPVALALGLGACSPKSEDTAANPQGTGEGTAYSTEKDTTVQANATPGSLRTGTIPENPGPVDPDATTGGAAGGMTQRPATPPNTAADGRVD